MYTLSGLSVMVIKLKHIKHTNVSVSHAFASRVSCPLKPHVIHRTNKEMLAKVNNASGRIGTFTANVCNVSGVIV